ncbi:hypothetical protein M0805_002295 [Coniferiporia weirii]|nr:hypothetical protein M0805_002295 [Coniferiporia weirii]
MTTHIPKAVLYYSRDSAWSSAALLALAEKGYDDGEIELKVVDIGRAENMTMSFLRINPKGTVPTLVVPLERTLAPNDDHRYKAVTDTKAVVEFLDKSRSAISRTHTISSAPAPALAPATIALSSTASTIIDLLHSEDADPDTLFYYNYVSDTVLSRTASTLLPFLTGRRDALGLFLANNETAEIQASEKTRKLWESRKAQMDNLLAVYSWIDTDDSALTAEQKTKRDEFRTVSRELWAVRFRKVLIALDKEMSGPFALGDQISVVDLHLGPWLARVASLCGGLPFDDGDSIIAKIQTRVGNDFVLPKNFQTFVSSEVGADPSLEITPGAKRAKLAAFWDAMKVRPSWIKIYGEKLH